jgi:hypothetical protein
VPDHDHVPPRVGGVDKGEEDIFPDPLSGALADGWHAGAAKALERQNAALLQAQPVAS